MNKEDYIYKNLKLLSLLIRKTINYDPCFITQMSNPIEREKYHFFIDYLKKLIHKNTKNSINVNKG